MNHNKVKTKIKKKKKTYDLHLTSPWSLDNLPKGLRDIIYKSLNNFSNRLFCMEYLDEAIFFLTVNKRGNKFTQKWSFMSHT